MSMSLIAGNLGAVQRLLDEAQVPWGVCSGAAAHLYGVRRPIENVDILLTPGCLRQVRDLLERKRYAAQYDGHILLWRGIKLFDDLAVTIAGRRQPFSLDASMQQHLRRLPLLGSRVQVLAPEDILVQKAFLTQTANSQGKPHRQDLETIVRVQGARLDLGYLALRVGLCQAGASTRDLLAEVGLVLPA
jgi:hypothetical protein